MHQAFADLLLLVHFAIAGFVTVLLPAVWIGAARGWRWVRNRPLRLLHLAAIVFVAAEALLGIACPLTIWEDALRGVSGQPGFVRRWVGAALYHDLPAWQFTAAYVAYAGATVLTWLAVPPRRAGEK